MEETIQEVPAFWSRWIRMTQEYLNLASLRKQIKRIRADVRMTAKMLSRLGEDNQRLKLQVASLTSERDDLMRELARYSVVDPNAKCPGCGATDGSIMAVQSTSEQRAYIEHTCSNCKFRWPENTVHPDAGKMWKTTMIARPPEGQVVSVSVRTP